MKPERKHPRLKEYDYSLPGYYYVTICTADEAVCLSRVGWEHAPTVARVVLTEEGEIAREQLFALEQRYPYVRIDQYVIMPNHIHAIIRLLAEPVERKRPGIPSIVGAFKSLTTRISNEHTGKAGRKMFQTSFYEEVLRNEKAYQECWRYIDENPLKWLLAPEELI